MFSFKIFTHTPCICLSIKQANRCYQPSQSDPAVASGTGARAGAGGDAGLPAALEAVAGVFWEVREVGRVSAYAG